VRLAHLADLHLGFRQYHRLNARGANQREADVATVFRQVVDAVIAARPDAVLVAGDVFHAVRPTNQAIVDCFRQLQRLQQALPGAPVVMVAGNHDTPRSVETGSILRLFAETGVHVVTDTAERLHFNDLGLTVLAVPHAAVTAPDRLALRRQGTSRYEVLLVHGEVEGLFPLDRWWVEPGGALLDSGELGRGGFDYVALGHYHVVREVREMQWYAGALDYVSPNPWGELAEERLSGVRGKAWLLVDLEARKVHPQFVEPPRAVVDLPAVQAEGLGAPELDGAIAARLAAVPGGLADKVVRLVVHDVPRHVVRELDHAAIRAAKATALHLHLDFRRPAVQRVTGVGAPGARQTLSDVLRGYLRGRPLPERVDRERFVAEGVALLDAAAAEAEGQA
jgi:DNA repair protein SbcD/Mre11